MQNDRWSSLSILTNYIIFLCIPIDGFCACVLSFYFIISSKIENSSNSMNLSRIIFSWISVKRVSDWWVFHQFLIQSCIHLLNEKETPEAKSTINISYNKEGNVFIFSSINWVVNEPAINWVVNEPASFTDSISFPHSTWYVFLFEIVIRWSRVSNRPSSVGPYLVWIYSLVGRRSWITYQSKKKKSNFEKNFQFQYFTKSTWSNTFIIS